MIDPGLALGSCNSLARTRLLGLEFGSGLGVRVRVRIRFRVRVEP